MPEPQLTLFALISAGWCAAFLSFFLTRLLSRAALLPDRPNRRSSHKVVTPRAGGIAIFCAWFVAIALIVVLFILTETETTLFTLACLSALAFGLGASDDILTLKPVVKLIGSVALAGLFVLLFGAIETIPVPFLADGVMRLGVLGPVVTVLWIVGFMNAFNFMDGVNGIAATTAAFAAFALSVAASLGGAIVWSISAVMLGVAICGFIPANLRGRIFMGDNGSLFIGFTLAALAVTTTRVSAGAVSILFLPTAFAPFLFDVAFTLAHRARRGRPLMSAHREHLYQLAVREGRSHVTVTAAYLTGVAFCSAVAMAMLSMPPRWQWTAPAALFAAMLVPALRLYRRSREVLEDGLEDGLEVGPATGEEDAADPAGVLDDDDAYVTGDLAQAAE